MKCTMALAAAVGLVVFGWGAVSDNTAVAKAPASQPASPSPATFTPAGPAVASSQSETVVMSGVASFYLSGTGPTWTLVTAPQHGTLKIFSPDRKSNYVAWTQGATATYVFPAGSSEVMRGVRNVGYVQYNPTPGYVGPDSFTWHSSDASETSKNVVCSITVMANHAPVAGNQSVTCVQDIVNKYVALNYSHADGGTLYADHPGQTMTFTLVGAPAHGTLKYYSGGKDGSPQGDYMAVPVGKPIPYYGWNYTPESGYSGSDSFTWKCSDSIDDSATVTASIAVALKGAGPATRPVVAFNEGQYTGPGDIVPDAMAWYGTRGYSRAVAATGTQKAVRINRYSDGASMDVLIKPNGDLDAAAAAIFCAGTLARVDLWYDQSGHGNDLLGGMHPEGKPLLTTFSCTKMTKHGTPYSEFTLDSLPCIEIQADDRLFCNTRFVGASPIGTFSTIASRRSHGFGGELMEMNYLNGRSTAIWLHFVVPGLNHASLSVSTGNKAGTKTTAGVDETDRAAFHAFQAIINDVSSVLNVDGTPTPGKLDDANLANNLAAECQGAFIGKMTEAGVWPTPFSPEEQTAMYQNQQRYWHLPPTLAAVRRGTAAAKYVKGKTPPIDGTVSPAWEWSSGGRALLLGKVESTGIGPLQTTAYVLLDKQNLYFACWCQEPNTDAVVANAKDRDGDFRNDDSVDLFLSPDGKTYYHFTVNPNGIFSTRKGQIAKEDAAWNSTATVKASIDKDRTWTVTMSLPLSDLGVTSGNNQTWMLNINRTKPVKDSAGATTFIKSSWSSTGHSNYGDASGWGKLTGVNIP